MKRSILIVDDDASIRTSLKDALAHADTEIRLADNSEAALASLENNPIDIVLADVRMPGMDGLQLLQRIRTGWPEVSVVMITAFDDLTTVATAMREGAADFLVKPLDLHQLRRVLGKLFEDRSARTEADPGQTGRTPAEFTEQLIGHDPKMVEIFKMIGQVATSRTSVIIRGESGTGKELIARAIHFNSPAADQPFVPVNCTALPTSLLESELFGHVRGSFTGATSNRRGRFAMAGRGTILLDEIGDTSLEFQSKLLRVLQENEYYPVGAEQPEQTRARVITATHRNLEEMITRGDFREDLYYRLRVVEILVPPLRDRVADIPLLTNYLVGKAARAADRDPPVLVPEAVDRLLDHSWPGNVRELENCLTRAVVLATGKVIRPEHLALGSSPDGSRARPRMLSEAERDHIAHVLKITGDHKSRTAEILGISRPRLDRLMKKHGLEPEGPEV